MQVSVCFAAQLFSVIFSLFFLRWRRRFTELKPERARFILLSDRLKYLSRISNISSSGTNMGSDRKNIQLSWWSSVYVNVFFLFFVFFILGLSCQLSLLVRSVLKENHVSGGNIFTQFVNNHLHTLNRKCWVWLSVHLKGTGWVAAAMRRCLALKIG